ncbi:uncharacterized protein TNCV_1922631 [Trichonephila clavipes]|nr:uncharacterized protein TNCV_1922631 [Trichonephila clavipes]
MYAPNTVNKLECIGHVQKRVGSHLRKLKNISEKGLGGKGNLRDNFIDKLQNYYGIDIRSNTKNLANMLEIQKSTSRELEESKPKLLDHSFTGGQFAILSDVMTMRLTFCPSCLSAG